MRFATGFGRGTRSGRAGLTPVVLVLYSWCLFFGLRPSFWNEKEDERFEILGCEAAEYGGIKGLSFDSGSDREVLSRCLDI